MTVLEPLGDRAFLARFPDIDCAAAWADAVRDVALAGVLDVVPAYDVVAVFADPDLVELDQLERTLGSLSPANRRAVRPREHTIPVRYNGEDLGEVAARLNLDPVEVIQAHAGTVYSVQAVGFLPGYPYAGPLPERLAGLPRRSSPRVRVPTGSVAIAGRHTGIYPQESPGGWHLLGRTPVRIVDLASGWFPIQVGDRLRFRSIDNAEFEALRGAPLNMQEHATWI
jgi:KipI family sensor histidine kinase inhibitor